MRFHHSVYSNKYKQNLILFVYGIQYKYDHIPKKYTYIKLLPPELIQIISTFILDYISLENYYKIIDNYNYHNPDMYIKHNRPQFYIGKILKKKIYNKFDHSRHKPYLVSYLGWEESFNEYISTAQIEKLNYKVSKYLLELKYNDDIDVYNVIDKKWHLGKVVHIHTLHNKIIGIDILTYYLNVLTKKKTYIYGKNIPIYSKHIMEKKFHYGNRYTYVKRFSLMWAYKKYKLYSQLKNNHKSNNVFDNINIIYTHYTSFTFKSDFEPNWYSIIEPITIQ